MKKTKFALLLPAACLLCSCGGEPGSDFKEIKKEDVPAKAKAIESKVAEDSFELPTKLTYTASFSASGKDVEKEYGGAKGDQKVVIDTENSYLYASCGGTFASDLEENATNIEAWTYKDGTSFILAAVIGDKKEYTKVDGGQEASNAYDYYCSNFFVDASSIKSMVKHLANSISELVATASIDMSVSTSSGGASVEAKFYSKGDGDLKASAKTSFSGSSESYSVEATYVIANYLPAYMHIKGSGKSDGADYSLEQKCLYEWNKADISSKPDLKDFKENKGE